MDPPQPIPGPVWNAFPMEHSTTLLSEDGLTVVLPSVEAGVVAIWEIDVGLCLVRRVSWLVPQTPFGDLSGARLSSAGLWLIGSEGDVLEIDLSPLDIRRHLSVRPHMLPGRSVDRAVFVQNERCLWVNLGGCIEEDEVAVIDLETDEILARPPVFAFAEVIGRTPAETLGFAVDADSEHLCDAAGAQVEPNPLAQVEDRVLGAVQNPRGSGYILLVEAFPEPGELEPEDMGVGRDDAPETVIGVLPVSNDGEPGQRVLLPNTNPDLVARLALSTDNRRVFVHTGGRDGYRLFSLHAGPEGLRLVFSEEVPRPSTLLASPSGRRALLLAAGEQQSPSGWRAERLGRDKPPPFCAEPARPIVFAESTLFPPLHGDLRQKAGELLRTDQPLEPWLNRMRRARRDDPRGLAELARVAHSVGCPSLARSVLDEGLDRFGGDERLELLAAEIDGWSGDWAATRRRLERLLGAHSDSVSAQGPEADLPSLAPDPAPPTSPSQSLAQPVLDDARGWAWRVLAEARLRLLDPGGAKAALLRAAPAAFDLCSPTPLEAIVEAIEAGPDLERSGLGAVLLACRDADRCFERGDASGAWAALDIPEVWTTRERQSAARLAEASMQKVPTTPLDALLCALGVARFIAPTSLRPRDIPGLGWDEDRLASVDARARAFLEEWGAKEAPDLNTGGEPLAGWGDPEPPPAPTT